MKSKVKEISSVDIDKIASLDQGQLKRAFVHVVTFVANQAFHYYPDTRRSNGVGAMTFSVTTLRIIDLIVTLNISSNYS